MDKPHFNKATKMNTRIKKVQLSLQAVSYCTVNRNLTNGDSEL